MKLFRFTTGVFSPAGFPGGGVADLQGTPPRTLARRRARAAFSLVEVVLAIGIVAFAFVALFSLLPIGMGVFREAMDTSVSAQIVQRIVSDAEETDFDVLKDDPGNSKGGDGNYFALPLRYFDDQGTEVKVASPGSPSDTEKRKILYWVRVRGTFPGKSDPSAHSSDYPTSLPSKPGVSRFNPRDETFLTVQIVNNPANQDFTIDGTTYLIKKTASVPLQTYSVVIARNGYPKKL